jgi:hypothetical protein
VTYFDRDDKKLNGSVPKTLADEVVALEDQLSAKMREVRACRLAALTEMPKCPDCNAGVYRPKCFFELGGDCPRHEVVADYGGMHALGLKFGLVVKTVGAK